MFIISLIIVIIIVIIIIIIIIIILLLLFLLLLSSFKIVTIEIAGVLNRAGLSSGSINMFSH